jgi:hypothetical protein
MKFLIWLFPLVACAHAPAPVAIAVPAAVVIEQPEVAVPTTHHSIIADYEQARAGERSILLHAKNAQTIDALSVLDAAARASLVPLRARHHKATGAEIEEAITSVGAVANFVAMHTPSK